MIALGIAACGGGDDNNDTGTSGGNSANLIKSNSANNGIQLTVGSKNFTEALILGNIYAQALQAAGYDVKTNLNLGSETIAYKALQDGEISGYPEYTSTLLTSIFGKEANQVPADAQAAYQQAQQELEPKGETAFAPTPFADANALGMLKTKADELGVTTISDLQGKSQDLTLYGSPECRQRVDCLVGLQDVYGLQFKSFNPVDIGLRYTVLDKGQADALDRVHLRRSARGEPGQVRPAPGRQGDLPLRERHLGHRPVDGPEGRARTTRRRSRRSSRASRCRSCRS